MIEERSTSWREAVKSLPLEVRRVVNGKARYSESSFTHSENELRAKALQDRLWYIESQKALGGGSVEGGVSGSSSSTKKRWEKLFEKYLEKESIQDDVVDSSTDKNVVGHVRRGTFGPATSSVLTAQLAEAAKAALDALNSSDNPTVANEDLIAPLPMRNGSGIFSAMSDRLMDKSISPTIIIDPTPPNSPLHSGGAVGLRGAASAASDPIIIVGEGEGDVGVGVGSDSVRGFQRPSSARAIPTERRISFTEFHNNPHIAIDSASAFLGGESNGFSHADSFTCKNGNLLGTKGVGMGLNKAMSLESLINQSRGQSVFPVMMSMPETKSERGMMRNTHTHTHTHTHTQTQFCSNEIFEAIKLHSWIMPFIVKILSDSFVSQLIKLHPLLPSSESDEHLAALIGLGSDVAALSSSFTLSRSASCAGFSALNLDSSQHSFKDDSFSSPPYGFLMRHSWKSLGTLYLNKDPSWRIWEKRLVLLCDNYIFEVIPGTCKIVGFAMLNNCKIVKSSVADKNNSSSASNLSSSFASSSGDPFDNFIECLSPPQYTAPSFISSLQEPNTGIGKKGIGGEGRGEGGGGGGGRGGRGREDGGGGYPASLPRKDSNDVNALCITVYRESIVTGGTATFWIRSQTDVLTDKLEILLSRASNLTTEDIYEYDTSDETCLGRGRFNEVRVGRRKILNHRSLFSRNAFKSRQSNCTTSSEDTDNSPPSSPSQSPPDSPVNVLSPRNAAITDISKGSGVLRDSQFPDVGVFFGDNEDDTSPLKVHKRTSYSSDFYALKFASKEVFWRRSEAGKERPDGLAREFLAQALVCQQQQNINSLYAGKTNPIVQIYGAFETMDGFAFELELMQHIDLYDKLSLGGLFTESETREVVIQLIDAISLCLDTGIAHRDVKLSNITFPLPDNKRTSPSSSSSSSPSPVIESNKTTIKLADFGMAGFAGLDGKLRGRCGTPGYVAPDILNASAHESYDMNVDMFSVGVCAYTLLCGYEPFYGADDKELIKSNRTVDFAFHDPEWTHISAECKDFIESCFAERASDRISPSQALKHPWLLY